MENEYLENEINEEFNEDSINTDNENINDIELDNTNEEDKEVIEIDKDFIMESILHELENNSEQKEEVEQSRSAEEHGEYYDTLIQINSHLEYIEEHLYEPEEPKTIETPLNQYGLTEILLVGVLVVLGLSFVFNVIKDNVIHIR